MAKTQSTYRIGLYECQISSGIAVKGKSVKKYYYGPLSRGFIDSIIIRDLRDMKHAGHDFEFPILVSTWRLGEGDPPKPLPRPSGKLTIKRAGGLRRAKRMIGIPTQRKKILRTEVSKVVIDSQYNVLSVEGNRIYTSK
jgi:hypothetical protein